MATKYAHPTLVMNIKREYFAAILSIPRRKNIEYRTMSKYWLRLLNGMTPPVPEARVRVLKVEKDKRKGEIRLHLGRVLEVKHWDRKRERRVL